MSGDQSVSTVECSRCGKTAPGVVQVPWGGALGETLRTRVCEACWAEWTEEEVRVINELRLNFMDPKAPAIVEQHLRRYLRLEE